VEYEKSISMLEFTIMCVPFTRKDKKKKGKSKIVYSLLIGEEQLDSWTSDEAESTIDLLASQQTVTSSTKSSEQSSQGLVKKIKVPFEFRFVSQDVSARKKTHRLAGTL